MWKFLSFTLNPKESLKIYKKINLKVFCLRKYKSLKGCPSCVSCLSPVYVFESIWVKAFHEIHYFIASIGHNLFMRFLFCSQLFVLQNNLILPKSTPYVKLFLIFPFECWEPTKVVQFKDSVLKKWIRQNKGKLSAQNFIHVKFQSQISSK